LRPRVDIRHIAYKVDPVGRDPWPIVGTLLLIVFIVAFAMIVWQGRQLSRPSSHKTPTDHIVLIASPEPTLLSSPTPESTATPVPQAQLVDTGGNKPNAPGAAAARPTSAPTLKPTAAPKPTATHRPPTAILNVTPKAGARTLDVTADASFSWDATGIVSYQFNWGDGLIDAPQSSPVASHPYPVSGNYVITVIVLNSVGLSSSASTTVTVN